MSNFIGVYNLKYSKLTKDDKTGATFEAFKTIPGLTKISVEPTSNTATFYGDNRASETVTRLGEIKVAVETGSLPLDILADLMGHEYDAANGRMIAKSTDVAPEVGILYTRNKANGELRHVKIFKMVFSLNKDESTTSGDSVEFQGDAIEATALPLNFNDEWKDMIEPNEANTLLVDKFLAGMIITE